MNPPSAERFIKILPLQAGKRQHAELVITKLSGSGREDWPDGVRPVFVQKS